MLKCKNKYLENEAVIGNFQCTISPMYFWGTNRIGGLNTMDLVQVTVLQREPSELLNSDFPFCLSKPDLIKN